MSEEILEQDAQETVDSSPAENSGNEQQQPEAQAEQAQASQEKTEKELPFHEHPRFRQIVEEKNQAKQMAEQVQRQLMQLQAQFEAQQKAAKGQSREEALFKKLEAVDPDLAQVMRDTYSKAGEVERVNKELEEFKQWKSQQEAQVRAREAYSTIEKLHSEFKVPKELQDFYVAQIKAAASENPNMGVADLPHAYKAIHERLNSYLESVKRQERASYVQAKKSDVKAPPAMAKGQAPGAQKQKFSSNPEEAKAEIVKTILKQARASKDV